MHDNLENIFNYYETRFIVQRLKTDYMSRIKKEIKDVSPIFVFLSTFFTVLILLIGVIKKLLDRNYPFHELGSVVLIIVGGNILIILVTFLLFNFHLIFQLIRLNNAKKDFNALKKILSNEYPFALYLRDFLTGSATKSFYVPGNAGGGGEIQGSRRMKIITRKLNLILPIVLLNNTKELTDRYTAITMYSSNDTWFEKFNYLLKKSSLVILDYGSEFEISKNIALEIDCVIREDKKAVLFCEQKFYDNVFKVYPGLKQHILAFSPIEKIKSGTLGNPNEEVIDKVIFSKELKTVLKDLKKKLENLSSRNETSIGDKTLIN